MNSPAEIIRQVLLDLGHVVTIGESDRSWTGYVAFLPEKPANAVCVYDTGGRRSGRIMSSGEQIEHPGIQIRIRGADYPDTWNKAREIALVLDQQIRRVVEMESQESWILRNFSGSGTAYAGVEDVGSKRFHNFTVSGNVTLELDDEGMVDLVDWFWSPIHDANNRELQVVDED